MNRYELREDITGAKWSIEKTWNENPCIPRMFLPDYNGKETPEEKEIMQNLTKEKVRAELQ